MPVPLKGVRIWLSGALPTNGSPSQRQSISSFVQQFSAMVFRNGGHILHGSHPSLTPILLAEAQHFIEAGGRKDCLTLAVSRYWSKDPARVPLQEWRNFCMVYETPEADGDNARDQSLWLLRQWMSARCDAFVAVGGEWWEAVVGRAGVPIEAGLAQDRGLPCFLLGGLGGAAQQYVRDNPRVIRSLKNGFDDPTNAGIATQEDVGALATTVYEQLSRLPLVHGRLDDGVSFRILALDGGGIKGAFSAAVLATLEANLGKPIAQHFDLIAGTSTGGIIAIGLGMDLSASEILEFYREQGPVIFPITRFLATQKRFLRHLFKPKYRQDVLLQKLQAVYFPDAQSRGLAESLCRLVVPAYDTVSGACHTFRTPHHPLLNSDAHTSAAEVALATAAAPTYFSAARVHNMVANGSYLDGGVWANSPVMAAIVEAVCYLDVSLDRIDILSIGTTDEPFAVNEFANAGKAGWGTTLINLLMNAQVDSAVSHARQLVGAPRFLRLNSVTPQGKYTLDNAKEIESLIALGHKTANESLTLSQVKSRFINGIPAMPWKQV